MSNPKEENPGGGPSGQAGAAKKAEKVQSSRYEWEGRSAESEVPPKSKAVKHSLMASLGAWLKKFFSDNRSFFDKDDDATPSAA